MASRITEVKRHLDGRTEEFDCERVAVADDRAIVRFVTPKPRAGYPKGTVTLGFFWRRRDYNLYRFVSPDGELLGHRLDVVADVTIEPDRLEYLDLIVDVRISPTGEPAVEDEEDAKRAAKKGLLEPKHVEAIDRALRAILRDHRRIVREAVASLPEDADDIEHPLPRAKKSTAKKKGR